MTETKWLTIAEASLLCSQMGLDRTAKTIRGWARNEHVTARKKSTSNGEMWILEKASLETKIKTEIEYRDQTKANQTTSIVSEPAQTRANQSEPVRTSADPSEPVRTRSEAFNGYNQGAYDDANGEQPPRQTRSDPSDRARLRELEDKIIALRVDVGWREQMMNKLRDENEKGQETLHAQARYIGHLESDLMRLGGKPDQTFLAAPKPQEQSTKETVVEPEVVSPQRPHPKQGHFYQNHSG